MPRYAKICQDMPSYEATAQDLEGIPEKRPWEHVDAAHCPPELVQSACQSLALGIPVLDLHTGNIARQSNDVK